MKNNKFNINKTISGFILISISLSLFISFFSFLFNWKYDQSEIYNNNSLLNNSNKIENSLGKIGALISDIVIYKGFGLASFFLPLLLFLMGINFIFCYKIFNLKKIILHSIFFITWIPIFFSLIIPNNEIFSGIFGFEIKNILIQLLGKTGLSIIIITIIILYLTIVFKISPSKLKNLNSNFFFNIKGSDIFFNIKKINERYFFYKKNKSFNNKNYTKKISKPDINLMNSLDNKNYINKNTLNYKYKIVEFLKINNIYIKNIEEIIGPSIILYEIQLFPKIKISKIKNLEDDIALYLSVLKVRIIAPIPERGTIGIEIPNKNRYIIYIKPLISSNNFQKSKFKLPIILGKTIFNETLVVDLSTMPHLLIAGATGQGKSIMINCIIISLLYKKSPQDLKFIMIDPKKVELHLYKKIENFFLVKNHNLKNCIITDNRKSENILNSLCIEMDLRYEKLKKSSVRNINEYNKLFLEKMQYIVLIIDEFSDLIVKTNRKIETYIIRLSQLARAVGIHLIIATQRPSVNVITGTIKANFTSRISFKVASKIDSRIILNNIGAEKLTGMGDMLFTNDNNIIRLQCPFISIKEIENITNFYNKKNYNFIKKCILPKPK